MNNATLHQGISNCQAVAAQHYENFPVASWLLPKQHRLPITVIYAFARSADDIADELTIPAKERIAVLDEFEQSLSDALAARPAPELFHAVRFIIQKYELPERYFFDLLSAFKQDTQQTRYHHYSDVIDYCQRSANPVGRLLLHIFNHTDDKYLNWSDNICTALQIINFLQDYEQDYSENNRIYFPQDELLKFEISEDDWSSRANDSKKKAFFNFQITRTRQLLKNGEKLGKVLPGRMGLEIRTIIHSGFAVLTKLENSKHTYDRPRLNIFEKIPILIKAILNV